MVRQKVLGMRYSAQCGGARVASALLLEPGLSVLYGTNGSGKSTVIGALLAALSGRSSRADVELHLEGPWLELLDASLRERLEGNEEQLALTYWRSEGLTKVADIEGLASSVAATSTFALVPAGEASARWEVWLTGRPTDGWLSEEFSDAIGQFEDTEWRREALYGDWDDPEHPWHGGRDDYFDHFEEQIVEAWFSRHRHPLIAAAATSVGNGIDFGFSRPWPAAFPRADGLPELLARVGVVDELRGISLVRAESSAALAQMTAAVAHSHLESTAAALDTQHEGRGGTRVKALAALPAWADSVTASANDVLARCFRTDLRLRLAVTGSLIDWVRQRPLSWTADGRSLDELSDAEGRWARLAAGIAVHDVARVRAPGPEGTVDAPGSGASTSEFLILDEPESGLHRSAEHTMALGLAALSDADNRYVIVATHSPHLLNEPRAHQYWLDGMAIKKELDRQARERLETLGLEPSDLLAMTQIILLVEGIHDKTVLETLIGQELDRMGVVIVAIHGARNLPHSVDSQVLFEYTDATMIAMVDNVAYEELQSAWEEALTTAATSGPDAASELLRHRLPRQIPENRFIGQWLTQAINRGLDERLHPFSLTAGDIIEYLPVHELVPNAGGKSWADLRAEMATATAAAHNGQDFKTWLRQNKDARFEPEDIRRAAQAVATRPPEFDHLLRVCKEVVDERRRR